MQRVCAPPCFAYVLQKGTPKTPPPDRWVALREVVRGEVAPVGFAPWRLAFLPPLPLPTALARLTGRRESGTTQRTWLQPKAGRPPHPVDPSGRRCHRTRKECL